MRLSLMAVLGQYLILSFDLAAVIALLAPPLFSLNDIGLDKWFLDCQDCFRATGG